MKKYSVMFILAIGMAGTPTYAINVAPVPDPVKKSDAVPATPPSAPLSTHDKKYAQEYTQYAYSLSTIVELQYQCMSPDASKKRFQAYLKDLTNHLSGQNIGFSSYQFRTDLQEGATLYGKTFTAFEDIAKIEVCKKFIETIDATVTDFEKSLAKQKDSILPSYTN